MVITMDASRQSRGFSLLELLLVVGVGAVLILAGLSAYRLVAEGNAATQGIRQLQTLKQQVQQAFQNDTGYGASASANLLATVQSMRMLPPDMAPNAATGAVSLRNGFNGTTTVVAGTTVSTFRITFNGVGASACNRMGTVFSTATSSDFVGVTIGATTLTVPTVATLATACANTTNTMTWEFR